MTICSQPDRRAEIRRINSKRVIRRLLDRRDAWIGQMTGVAEMALIDGGAAAEFRVEPGSRKGVISLERCRERGFFDTDAIGERIDARRLDQFAILHIWSDTPGERTAQKKRLAQVCVFGFGNGTGEIVGGGRWTVLDTRLLHPGIDGNPDHPARPRRG